MVRVSRRGIRARQLNPLCYHYYADRVGYLEDEMTLDERIQEAAESGTNSCKHQINQILADSLAAISKHYAIPVGELLNVVKDEMNHE